MNNDIDSIDGVLEALDLIISQSATANNPQGYFAYIYRRTTAQIKTGIETNRFENSKRMELFDIKFARYYLDAYHNFSEQEPVSQSWKTCFEAKKEDLIIVQRLMMGMNAHINLDLAVAASSFMEGQPIQDFKHDFMVVNDILAELTNEMQSKLGKTSFFMFLLDWIGKKKDDQAINFSIAKAREQSWRTAQIMWSLEKDEKVKFQSEVDLYVSKVSHIIKKPGSGLLKTAIKIIKTFEEKDVAVVLRKMGE